MAKKEPIPCELDLDILVQLYQHRAFSTDQIGRFFSMSEGYTYKKLSTLRRRGWLISETIKGTFTSEKYQGKFHRISEGGISCLIEAGRIKQTELSKVKQAHHLRVNPSFLPYLLLVNEIYLCLECDGWQFTDSRDAKKKYGLNRSDNIQGLLKHESNETEYALYLFDKPSHKHMKKLLREMHNYDRLNSKAIFFTNLQTFEFLVEELMKDQTAVAISEHVKLFYHKFGLYYLAKFFSETEMNIFIEEELKFRIIKDAVRPFGFHDQVFQTVVEDDGEEKFIVNLLDSDLKKILDLMKYTKDLYEAAGRKVIVLSGGKMFDVHQKLLEHYPHIEFFEVDPWAVMEYVDS